MSKSNYVIGVGTPNLSIFIWKRPNKQDILKITLMLFNVRVIIRETNKWLGA